MAVSPDEVHSHMLPQLSVLLQAPASLSGALPGPLPTDVARSPHTDAEEPLKAVPCSGPHPCDRLASPYCMKVPTCTTCMLSRTNDLTSFGSSLLSTPAGREMPWMPGISLGKIRRSSSADSNNATNAELRMMVGTS